MNAHSEQVQLFTSPASFSGDEKLVSRKQWVNPDFVARFFPPLRRGGSGGWTGLSERERANKSLKS